MSSMVRLPLLTLAAVMAASPAAFAQDAAEWDRNRAQLVAQQPGPMAAEIARWERLWEDRQAQLPFSDYATFLLANPGFPDETTLRARAEQRLRESKREADAANLSKTKFLAAVSHDLLQPLNAARLFTSALSQDMGAEDMKRTIGHIDSSLQSAEELLGALPEDKAISALVAGLPLPLSHLVVSDESKWRRLLTPRSVMIFACVFLACKITEHRDIPLKALLPPDGSSGCFPCGYAWEQTS